MTEKIAEKIKIGQNQSGMLRRALERIIQLYTDRSHFVYELLQNAEDAKATSIIFTQYSDRLEVMHDGKPFTKENLQSLCDIGKSDKVNDLNQIGEFGVGFKSVFGICDKVLLYSAPENYDEENLADTCKFAIEITNFTEPADISFESFGDSYTTKFVFPYVVGESFSGFKNLKKLNRTLSSKLQNLGVTTLLFMKNLELIEYRIELDTTPITGRYLLEKSKINNHCTLVSAYGHRNTQQEIRSDEEISYLRFSRPLDIQNRKSVDIAFPVTVKPDGGYEFLKTQNRYISVYFPTETESKLDFIVQGPYRTTPNRSSIPIDDEQNIALANETSELLKDAIIELRDSNKLDMSFMKILPYDIIKLSGNCLFYSLHAILCKLCTTENIIPCLNGGYVSSHQAKIARGKELTNVFSDKLLSELINDNTQYKWLSTKLTENNDEYRNLFDFFIKILQIDLIKAEDLRSYIVQNPSFLPNQNNSWLKQFYTLLSNIPSLFSKIRHEPNLLTAKIVKNSKGIFVSPYKKDGNKFSPNVFLPLDSIKNDDINYVDEDIYFDIPDFFKDTLTLSKPDKYQYYLADIIKRYKNNYSPADPKHIDDIKFLCDYSKSPDHKQEVATVINESFLLRCNDGHAYNAHTDKIFSPIDEQGNHIQDYLKNIDDDAVFVDYEFYKSNGITTDMLKILGVHTSLLCDQDVTSGAYQTGKRGRQPEWYTEGDFRWKLSLIHLDDALLYISRNPSQTNSFIKSKIIFKTLLDNEDKLLGNIRINGQTLAQENQPCILLDTLKKYDDKWLYNKHNNLDYALNMSKNDLCEPIYGKPKSDSEVYDLLNFKKTENEEVEELKKTIPEDKLNAFFVQECRKRFQCDPEEIVKRIFNVNSTSYETEAQSIVPFPTSSVKNWQTLRKHAAEMLYFANPKSYEYAIRHIRVNTHTSQSRAYIKNFYQSDYSRDYACQLCHEYVQSIDTVQLLNKQETDLDAMYLSLCPNCARRFKGLSSDPNFCQQLKNSILSIDEKQLSTTGYFSLEIDGCNIWFTNLHIAEIRELLLLENDKEKNYSISSSSNEVISTSARDDSYIGKHIQRKDGTSGVILSSDSEHLTVKWEKGKTAGTESQISLTLLNIPNAFRITP